MFVKVGFMKNQGFTRVSGWFSSVVVGVVVGFLFALVASVVPAFLMAHDLLSTSHIGVMSIVILAVGSMIGAYIAAVRHGCNGMVIGIFVGLFDLLLVVFLGVMFCTVSFDIIDISLFFVKFFSLVLFGAIGGIFGINTRS